MYRELTNLLPSERSRAFRQEYFRRLATTTLWMLTLVVIAVGVMLVPSYAISNEEVAAKRAELATITATLESSAEKEVGARLGKLEANVAHLKRLTNAPTASGAIRGVLSVPRAGIAITEIAYTPNPGSEGTLVLTGVASTRDALRLYNLSLSALPYVSKSDLPISAYAKETELPFTITLTGSLTP